MADDFTANAALPRAQAATRVETLGQLGALVRVRRKERGLTLDVLAVKTRISKPYLSNIETGRAPGPASDEKLRRIEKALGWAAGHLVGQAAWLRTPASVRKLVRGALEAQREAGARLSPGVGDVPGSLPRRADGTLDLDALLRLAGKGAGGQVPNAAGTGEEREPKTFDVPTRASAPLSGPLGAVVGPVRMVPLINRVAAGRATEFTDLGYPVGFADDYVPALEAAAETPAGGEPSGRGGGGPARGMFAVRVSGDSMVPEFFEGEVLIVGSAAGAAGSASNEGPTNAGDAREAPQAAGEGAAGSSGEGGATPRDAGEIRDGAVCLVRLDAAEDFAQTLKRVRFDAANPDLVHLVPSNPAYLPRTVARERITGMYPVLWKLTRVGG
jgi:transcriptional regulator with XRE-family HTH domain